MNQSEQPEAIRLADALRDGQYSLYQERAATEEELRRLHARVQELESKLKRAAEVERAEILERVKNRAVAGALLVKDFQSIVADCGPAAQRATLSDSQINALADAYMGLDSSYAALRKFARAIERAYGIEKEEN